MEWLEEPMQLSQIAKTKIELFSSSHSNSFHTEFVEHFPCFSSSQVTLLFKLQNLQCICLFLSNGGKQKERYYREKRMLAPSKFCKQWEDA